MRLGAHFLPENRPLFLESVRAAEACGYARAWLVDSQMLWQDVYVYLTMALEDTERITFGTGVTNPQTRHVTVTASAHATLAHLHPGRVILGIGRGDSAVRTLGLRPARTQEQGETVSRLRELMSGRPVELEGAQAAIRWASEDVPIMMAAMGPRNLRLPGALADIAQLQVGANPANVRWGIEHVRAGAEAAGRDPAAVEISVVCGLWVGDDLEEGRRAVRLGPAASANHVADLIRHSREDLPDELTRIAEARDRHYDYYGGHLDPEADHADFLTAELIDDWAIVGPPEACLPRLRGLADLGVDEYSHAYLNGQFDQLERIGGEIIPELLGEGPAARPKAGRS